MSTVLVQAKSISTNQKAERLMGGLQQYDTAAIQQRWSNHWEVKGYFRSKPNAEKKPFTIAMPPPNVTGALHLGHAITSTLQDVITRFKRMQGYEALWQPGADHAGIATQAVVEKRLFELEKKTRHDIGRDALVARIWDWKREYEARIISQLKAMGTSCDWSRWRFTLDDGCARAVRLTFFKMFRDGLIYRGKRLVNWDVQLQTAVADDEVYHADVQGNLWHIQYPVVDSAECVVVATTRPETMLGDTAVAVHPDDARYKHLIGKSVMLPLMERSIPVIADGLLVNPEFGTGVVKVTPAHDPNDYACGLRNNLPMVNVMTTDGKINANGGKYEGLPREKARKQIAADLEALGLIAKVEAHRHNVGHSDRSKTAIEPYLSDQWFVRMGDVDGKPGLAEKAMETVRDGRVKFHPERYAETYLSWLGEKRDWCISRQLWWGHQIAIWYCKTCTENDLRQAFGARSESVAWKFDSEQQQWLISSLEDLDCNAIPGHTLTRDPDVLDTWFSSALWPHSTLGWPEKTADLEYYYPTNLLDTAREIITLWVARMVIMSDYNLGVVPFRDVFIHPVIQDGNGQPMKKSLGNGVDPFDIIDKYGADAMRYTLVAMTTETQDVRMPVKKEKLPDGREVNTSEKFEIGRNFGTKIFNAAKFMLTNLEGYTPDHLNRKMLAFEDRWILSRLVANIDAVETALESYQFSEAARLLYDFIWGDLCDWYIEIVKPRLREPDLKPTAQRVIALVLDKTMKLLHPIMPFVTEEIWHALGEAAPERGWPDAIPAAESVCIAPWPNPVYEWQSEAIENQMAELQGVVRAIRNIRSQFNVDSKTAVAVSVECTAEMAEFLNGNVGIITSLGRTSSFVAGPEVAQPPKSAAAVLAGCKIYVPLADLIDVEAELTRQSKKQSELEKRLAGVRVKLSSESFTAKAPADVVQQHRDLESELLGQLEAIRQVLADLGV